MVFRFRREDADEKSGPNNERGSRAAYELFDLISTLDHCLDAIEVGKSLPRL